jgi:hypothetical protein
MIRELGFFVDSLFFGVVGYAAMSANEEHKRQGDRWADTIVREIPKGSPDSEAGRFVLGLVIGVMADMALVIAGLLLVMLY